MLIQIALLFSLCLTGIVLAETCEPASLADQQFLTVKLYEKGEQKKSLVDFTIQTAKGGKIRYVSGGELSPDQSENDLKVGIRAMGSTKRLDNQQFHLVLKLEVGETVTSNDPKTQVVRSQTVEIQSDLVTGIPKHVHCGGKQWLELQLD